MTTPFEDIATTAKKPRRFARIRTSFLTGLIVIAPVGLTIWLMWTLIGWVDGFVLPLIPDRYQPEQYLGINFRGVGVVIFLVFTVIVGWIAKGLIGRSLIRFAESWSTACRWSGRSIPAPNRSPKRSSPSPSAVSRRPA